MVGQRKVEFTNFFFFFLILYLLVYDLFLFKNFCAFSRPVLVFCFVLFFSLKLMLSFLICHHLFCFFSPVFSFLPKFLLPQLTSMMRRMRIHLETM